MKIKTNHGSSFQGSSNYLFLLWSGRQWRSFWLHLSLSLPGCWEWKRNYYSVISLVLQKNKISKELTRLMFEIIFMRLTDGWCIYYFLLSLSSAPSTLEISLSLETWQEELLFDRISLGITPKKRDRKRNVIPNKADPWTIF